MKQKDMSVPNSCSHEQEISHNQMSNGTAHGHASPLKFYPTNFAVRSFIDWLIIIYY